HLNAARQGESLDLMSNRRLERSVADDDESGGRMLEDQPGKGLQHHVGRLLRCQSSHKTNNEIIRRKSQFRASQMAWREFKPFNSVGNAMNDPWVDPELTGVRFFFNRKHDQSCGRAGQPFFGRRVEPALERRQRWVKRDKGVWRVEGRDTEP